MVYVEVIRNIPLLLQLLFWYNAVLGPLPQPRDSIGFGAGLFLNSRGLFMPRPLYAGEPGPSASRSSLGIVGTIVFRRWARKQQEQTGRQYPVGLVTIALVLVLPAPRVAASGAVRHQSDHLRHAREGHASTCAAACRSCPNSSRCSSASSSTRRPSSPRWCAPASWPSRKGQTEAAGSLGLRPAQTLRLVVIPQAMRVIIPPLTSQYLNLTKNSSLAVAIGYPDLVQVFTGTVLNQTGQAIEVVVITMARLSHDQPRDVVRDEHLQPPQRDRGTVGHHHEHRRRHIRLRPAPADRSPAAAESRAAGPSPGCGRTCSPARSTRC